MPVLIAPLPSTTEFSSSATALAAHLAETCRTGSSRTGIVAPLAY